MSKVQFWKRRNANITEYDPTYRVVYLGNVLTGWAKGDGCVDKPLSTLWRNHVSSDKADIVMKVTIVGSGLKAVTKEHGLTEYWANRITYTMAHPAYPRVFCWIYRHEGRKMKQELRCHAVLCPKEEKATLMATQLSERLHRALVDFRKEKKARQDARLSLANCIHDNPSMPYRKLLLQAGTSNYKPPIERSKSAPKLSSIEEAVHEEDEEVEEEEEDLEMCFGEECEVAVTSVEISPRIPRLPSSSPPCLPSSKNDAVLIFDPEEDSDDEDEIRDYIGDIVGDLGEADSAASVSPGSNHGRSGSECERRRDEDSLSENSDSGHHSGSISQSLSKLKITEQDTISDESGYSEEPIASGKEVTVVKVNNSDNCDKFLGEDSGRQCNSQHRLEINLSDNQPSQHITITSRVVPRSHGVESHPVPRSPSIESHHVPISPSLESQSVPISHSVDLKAVPVSHHVRSNSVPRSQPIDLNRLPHFDTNLNINISPREFMSKSPCGESVSLPVSPNVSSPRHTGSPLSSSPREIVSTSPRVTDLSVQGVLMSEFTTADKLRYIEKSKKTRHSISMVNLQEFCINI